MTTVLSPSGVELPDGGEPHSRAQVNRNFTKINDLWTATINKAKPYSNSQHTNPDAGLNAALSGGTKQLVVQAGSTVVTPDANGYATITFPAAFPTGVICATVSNGDNSITNGARLLISLGTAALNTTSLFIRVWDTGAGAGYTGVTRVEWIALGW